MQLLLSNNFAQRDKKSRLSPRQVTKLSRPLARKMTVAASIRGASLRAKPMHPAGEVAFQPEMGYLCKRLTEAVLKAGSP
jgi:hypothetical protein